MQLLKWHRLSLLFAFVLVTRPVVASAKNADTFELTAPQDGKYGKNGKKKNAPKRASDASAVPEGAAADCRISAVAAGLHGLTEASGVAISRRNPGILWSHGDSYAGEPALHAFDSRGAAKGKIRLEGIAVADWEDIAVGSCGASSCIYIADIGDNNGSRKNIAIHRLPEPLPGDLTARGGESFQATFPDGSQDAEAFFITPSGEMFLVTKGDSGPIALYRVGSWPKAGALVPLQKIGVLQSGVVRKNQWITGAGASPDGRWVALRTHGAVYFYEAARLLKGDFGAPLRLDVTSLGEPQGEGVALGANGALFLTGESGRKGVPGTLAVGTCKLP